MNKYLSLFSLFVVIDGAYAVSSEEPQKFFSGNSYYDVQYFDTSNTVIQSGATVNAPAGMDIMLAENMTHYVYNDGVINGTINTNGENLFLYNTGTITGGISALVDGTVTQRITSEAELTYVNVDAIDYHVEIDGYNNLNFCDIKDIDADLFIIRDSTIIIENETDWLHWKDDNNYRLEGNNKLIVNLNKDSSSDSVIVDNSSNKGNIVIQDPSLDNLHKIELENDGSGIIPHIVRETDYDKINNNQTNNDGAGNSSDNKDPLEVIRDNNPGDKLVNAIDSADNQNEINRLKNSSYRYNHAILLRPIIAINNFTLNNDMNYTNDGNIGLSPYYIASDSSSIFGGRLFINKNYKNTYFNLGLDLSRFNYSDNLNDFSGVTYGFDVKAKHDFDNIWVNAVLGATLANYHADYVTNDKEVKKDPFAKSFYGSGDVGFNIKAFDKTTISPFMGVAYQQYSVTDVSVYDTNIRAGSNVKYSFTVDDIQYEYSASGAINDDFDLFIKLKFGFVALTDMAGASFGLDIFSDENDVYYKLSANAKIVF